MSGQGVRSTGRVQGRPGRVALALEPAGLGAGDPLVRALAVCIRQAHARRVGRGPLDSMP
jgi:hypothetical protein